MQRKLGPLDEARIVAAARKLFHRERVPTWLRVRAVLAYFYGMSFRRVARYFGCFSPEAVRSWWHRLSFLFQYPRGVHGVVAADETRVHRGQRSRHRIVLRSRGQGKKEMRRETKRIPASHLLWVSVDVDTLEVVNVRLSTYSTNEDCYEFLAETRARAQTDPFIIHDRAVWYTTQSEKLGLRHEQVKGGPRSLVECWNRQLKHRLDGFWRAFPPNASLDSMDRWFRAYATLWNFTRCYRSA